MPRLLALLLLTVFLSEPVAAQQPSSFPAIGKIERLDDRFDKLVPADAKIEVLASGFEWSEGPVWIGERTGEAAKSDPALGEGGCLLFSDIPNNRIMRWSPKTGLSVFLKPAGYSGPSGYGNEPGSNGLALDREGRLTICEHGDRRVARLTPGGGKLTLADRYQGKRLNSPNDLCFDAAGNIYFTDPPYGLPKGADDPRRELDFCGVYLLRTGDREPVLLTKEFSRPNGVALSPDQKTLYVAQSDSAAPIVRSFPVKDDGTIGEGKTLFDASEYMNKPGYPGAPDGLRVDAAGNLWATGPGGVWCLSPEGEPLGRISTGERTANCELAPDGTLYLTADMYLCRVKTNAKPGK